MRIQLPRTYSQNDPRWRNTTLGTSGTIGDYGCLLTDIAMICTHYGHDETPPSINEKLKQHGGFINGNIYVWGALSNIYSDIVYQGQTQTPDALTKAQMDTIRNSINKGYPVILQIDTVPVTAAFDEHWILAIDYDGDDFIVQDPWDGGVKRITSWGVRPQELIYAFAYYSGTPTVTIVQPSQPPASTSSGDVSVNAGIFQQLVSKSTQWDTVSTFLSIDKHDEAGGQKAIDMINQLRTQLVQAGQEKNAASSTLSQLQTSYNALQSQYGNLQMQYNTLQQNYIALQQSGGNSSQAMIQLVKNYDDAQQTIRDLQVEIVRLKQENSKPASTDGQYPPPQDNPSTKPFWQSKKVIVTGASGLLSAGLIALQTLQIKPGDDWQSIGVKLFSAAIGALGISTVANQYVKMQGMIDNTALLKE